MNLEFENQGTNTYLVYKLTETDEVDTLSLGMLTNNKIPGLAPVMFTQRDNTKYIKYNVSAKVPVQQLFSRAVNRKRLLGVFNGIVNAMLSAEEYMIDTNTILVDLNYMFTDVTTCETILISLPIDSVAKTAALSDLGTLFKNIVFSTQFDQTENCDYVAKLINYLNSTPVFTLNSFKEVLDSLDNPVTAQQQTVPMQQQPVMQPQQSMGMQSMAQQAVSAPVAPQPAVQPVQTPQMMSVPAVPSAPQKGKKNGSAAIPAAANAVPANPDEKAMSMFTLLCHYNKENAQLYKEQRARRKEQAALAKQQNTAATGAPATTSSKGKGKAPANMGFAIPGMSDTPVPAPMAQTAIPTQAPAAKAAPVSPAMPQTIPAPQAVSMPVQQPVAAPVSPPIQPVSPASVAMPQQSMGGPANFGETTVLGMGGGVGETTVLGMTSMAMELKPYLIRMKNNERIPIDKPVFRVGKEKSYVDYFISDNTAISRSHANIIARDGEYYLVDTNSTNHTYLNNTMLQSNVEERLTAGARIRFANEDFEFILS